MASVVVDGMVLPVSLDGHPVLDFCNARARWGTPEPKEYLVSHAHLTVWARERGLIAAAEVDRLRRLAVARPDEAAAVVARALRFRDALYAVLVGPASAEDWAGVHAAGGPAAATRALGAGTPAGWRGAGAGTRCGRGCGSTTGTSSASTRTWTGCAARRPRWGSRGSRRGSLWSRRSARHCGPTGCATASTSGSR